MIGHVMIVEGMIMGEKTVVCTKALYDGFLRASFLSVPYHLCFFFTLILCVSFSTSSILLSASHIHLNLHHLADVLIQIAVLFKSQSMNTSILVH